MNYNAVPVSFIFFTLKLPLTLVFFTCFFLGVIIASIFWYQRYKTLERKYERTSKLLFSKEKLEDEQLFNYNDRLGEQRRKNGT